MTVRTRRRYLAVRIHTSKTLPAESDFRNAIWKRLQELYGELGVSSIGFWLTSYVPQKKSAIIRCEHLQVRPLRAALATITEINTKPLLLQVVGISGTIRKILTHLPEIDPKQVIRPRKHR